MKSLWMYSGPVRRESALRVSAWTLCVVLWLLAPAWADDPPTERIIANGVLLTPRSTLQAKQGELHFFVGRSRTPISPWVWLPAGENRVEFQVEDEPHRFHFHIRPEVLEIAGQEHPAALIDISLISRGGDAPAIVWCGWRHQPGTAPQEAAQGILLTESDPPFRIQAPPLPWEETWTWFFEGSAFMRNRFALYFIEADSAWERTQAVRLDQPPFRELEPESLIGMTRLRLPSNAQSDAALRVIVPFQPLDYDDFQAWQWRSDGTLAEPEDEPETVEASQPEETPQVLEHKDEEEIEDAGDADDSETEQQEPEEESAEEN